MSDKIQIMFELMMALNPMFDAIDLELLEKFVAKGEQLERSEMMLPRLPSGRPFHAQTAQARSLLNFLKARINLEAPYRGKGAGG